jgi:hypothetical protein
MNTYETKSLAITAARTALKALGVKDAMSEVHFRLTPRGEQWSWHQIDLGTGQVATGELIKDGAEDAIPPLAPVTRVPSKGAKPAAPKAAKAPKLAGKREAARLAKIAAADARNKAPKPPKAPRVVKPTGQRAAVETAAAAGKLPTPPDFSADTHKRFRKTLEGLVAAAKAGNLKALKADTTERKSSSRNAICRYRDLCIVALEAQRKAAKPAPQKAPAQKAA